MSEESVFQKFMRQDIATIMSEALDDLYAIDNELADQLREDEVVVTQLSRQAVMLFEYLARNEVQRLTISQASDRFSTLLACLLMIYTMGYEAGRHNSVRDEPRPDPAIWGEIFHLADNQ